MHWKPRQHVLLGAALCGLLIASGTAESAPQGATEEATQAAAPPVSLTCEVFCSETKLRTANAWIRWTLGPAPALEAAGLADAAQAPQRLETTVFRDGFKQDDLYLRLPVAGPGVEALTEAPASKLRAYQLSIISREEPEALAAVAGELPAGTSAVIEGLEPGVNYTWRLVIETGDGEFVSETVTCQAPVCPADMQGEGSR